MSDYLDPANEELLKDFFEEAQAQVETLEQNILLLENEPDNHEAIDEIFRAAHTLKGGAATVEMDEIAEFTHIVEDVLDELRSGNLRTTPDVVDQLLTSLDIIKAMLDARLNGEVYNEDISETSEALKALLGGEKKPQGKEKPAGKDVEKKTEPELKELTELERLEIEEIAKSSTVYKVTVKFNPDYVMNTVGGVQVYAALKEIGRIVKTSPEFEKLYEDNFYPEVEYWVATDEKPEEIQKICEIPDVTIASVVEPVSVEGGRERGEGEEKEEKKEEKKKQEKGSQEEIEKQKLSKKGEKSEEVQKQKQLKKPVVHGSVLRVDSSRVDDLLNLVSETVINKATFNQIANTFISNLQELQETQVTYREKLKDLFTFIEERVGALTSNNGHNGVSIKKELQENFGELFNIFDNFEANLKVTVNQFRSNAQNLSRITGDLQEGVMRIRMVPVSQIFSRFPRLVRDLSKNLKKKIVLDIEGEDTELDKSVIEDLLDPLIHCVRNSIDHGIESPADRVKVGKPEEGHILLKARNEGNMIIIEISDDGKGIDVEAVKKRAVERGLIHPNKSLTDIEAFNLIFEPGFSTATKITNISGRGVGLDVVRKQVEKLNGTVEVFSVKGEGTTFTIKLPLTLAIIQGLLVKVGEEIYAIPITSVIESLRIKPSEIKMLDSYEVFNIRKDVLSLLRLNRLFRIPTDEDKQFYFIVIVGSGDKKVGLMVDSLIGEEDVVIKPLRDRFTNTPGIAGATILGDGTVALILDVNQLLELGLKHESERVKSTTISGR